jgi:hypothetical protein
VRANVSKNPDPLSLTVDPLSRSQCRSTGEEGGVKNLLLRDLGFLLSCNARAHHNSVQQIRNWSVFITCSGGALEC